MAWNGVHVRRADEHDLETVLELTGELREELLHTRNRSTTRTPAERYAEVLADETCEIALAVAREGAREGAAEVVIGMAVLSVARTNALLELPSLHVTHVVVSAAHRRRGAGRALVARAVAFAEEQGLEQIVVSVPPTSREAARFFARLGLTPISVRRTAPVALVRRRLSQAERSGEPAARRARRLSARTVRVRAAEQSGS